MEAKVLYRHFLLDSRVHCGLLGYAGLVRAILAREDCDQVVNATTSDLRGGDTAMTLALRHLPLQNFLPWDVSGRPESEYCEEDSRYSAGAGKGVGASNGSASKKSVIQKERERARHHEFERWQDLLCELAQQMSPE